MSSHKFLLIFLTLILFAGCSNRIISSTEEEFPPTRKGVILASGEEFPLEAGGYSWERKKGLETESITTDHASPLQMAEQITPITVHAQEKIQIQIEKDPSIRIYIWNENGRGNEVEVSSNHMISPPDNGSYLYEVKAEWENGSVSYTFVLKVN
jgi:hypothetical protein